VKYACIAEHRVQHPVNMMCNVLNVSRLGFHAAQVRAPSDSSHGGSAASPRDPHDSSRESERAAARAAKRAAAQ